MIEPGRLTPRQLARLYAPGSDITARLFLAVEEAREAFAEIADADSPTGRAALVALEILADAAALAAPDEV